MTPKFDRRLSPEALAYLETRPRWWQDVLDYRFIDASDRKQPLFLAVRDGYLSAYVEGQSVPEIRFNVRNRLARLCIHQKFVRDGIEGQDTIDFNGDHIDGKPYSENPLSAWVTRARRSAQRKVEKQGVTVILGGNANVIDVEMALPANDKPPHADRIDIVALEKSHAGLNIVLYEAKHFTNPYLRAKNHQPEVLKQLGRYETWINTEDRADQVVAAYRRACGLLVKLHTMRNSAVHPLVQEAAEEGSNLQVDRKPRLIVFGYRDEQYNDFWKPHESVLKDAGVSLIIKPTAQEICLPTTAPSHA